MLIGSGQPVYVYDKEKSMQPTDIILDENEIREIIQKIAKYSGRQSLFLEDLAVLRCYWNRDTHLSS